VSFSVAALPDPGVVHFYSYATGISIELPVGFESDGADGTSARYRDGDALVQVRVVGEVPAGSDGQAAVRELADGFAARGGVLTRRDRSVDDCPAATVVTRSAGRAEHQTVLAADGRLLTVVGVAPEPDVDALLAAYDTAVDSVRVIPL
jgi:hypothetical protein